MKKGIQCLFCLFVVMVIVGFVSYFMVVDIIKIVLVGLVIGLVVQYGDMQCVGVLMVIEQINKVGGVNGV